MVESNISRQRLAEIIYEHDHPRAKIKLLKHNLDGSPQNECFSIGVLGREQVGKSTFINALFGTNFIRNQQQLEQRTTDGIDYSLHNINGLDVHLFDCEGFFSDSVMNNLKALIQQRDVDKIQTNQQILDEAIERNILGGLRMVKLMSGICDIIFILTRHGDNLNFLVDNLKLNERSYVSKQLFEKTYFIIRVEGHEQQEIKDECILRLQQTFLNFSATDVQSRCRFISEITQYDQILKLVKFNKQVADQLFNTIMEEYQQSVKNININELITNFRKDISTILVQNTIKYAVEYANSFKTVKQITNIHTETENLSYLEKLLTRSFKWTALKILKYYDDLKQEQNKLEIFLQDSRTLENLQRAAVDQLQVNRVSTLISASLGMASGIFGIGAVVFPPLWVASLAFAGAASVAQGSGYFVNRQNNGEILEKISRKSANWYYKKYKQLLEILSTMSIDQFNYLKACYLYTKTGDKQQFASHEIEILEKFEELMLQSQLHTNSMNFLLLDWKEIINNLDFQQNMSQVIYDYINSNNIMRAQEEVLREVNQKFKKMNDVNLIIKQFLETIEFALQVE